MSVATSTALIVGGIAAAGIGGAASLAAGGEQAGASENAAQLQAQEAQNSLNFQEQEFNTQQANEAPFLQAGTGAVNTLAAGLQPGGQFTQQWNTPFNAPTAEQAAQYPGYQFGLQQGEGALQNSAAASGGLLSGNTAEGLNNYAQNYAQSDYTNVYNQALQQYQQQYNIFQNNQNTQYNRYASLAGLGQTTAGQLGQQGQAAAQNVGNIDLTSGAQQGQDIQNAAAAQASGYVGASNALGSGASNLSQYALLQQLLNNQGGGGGVNMEGGNSAIFG